MIERETADALREAIEALDHAMELVSGLRNVRSTWDDPHAVAGALVMIHMGVQHANALLHSILDKGR